MSETIKTGGKKTTENKRTDGSSSDDEERLIRVMERELQRQNDWLHPERAPTKRKIDATMTREDIQDIIDDYGEEYASFMNPIIERLSEDDINQIGSAFEYDFNAGYYKSVIILSNILGIEEPRLAIRTVERNSKSRTYYHKEKGVIVIPNREGDDENEFILNAIDSISHEMWHAYQRDVIAKGGERASIYQENFDSYISAEKDVEGYFFQPVELEAYAFSSKIVDKFLDTRLKIMMDEYEKTEGLVKWCRENDNEPVSELFAEENRKRMQMIRQIADSEYYKKRMDKKNPQDRA